MNYYQNQATTEIGERSVSFAGPNIWRTIPRDIKLLLRYVEDFSHASQLALIRRYHVIQFVSIA